MKIEFAKPTKFEVPVQKSLDHITKDETMDEAQSATA